MKNPAKVILLNQDLVREKLRQKKFDDVSLSSWGHLDEFIDFIISFGIFTSTLAILSHTKQPEGLAKATFFKNNKKNSFFTRQTERSSI